MNALRHVVLVATLTALSITNLAAADHATGNATIVGTSWSSGTYAYDGSGNVTQIGDDVYRYDEYGRLARATVGPPSTPAATTTQQFTYDAYGNLTTIITTAPSGTRTGGFAVNAATNQLTGNCPAGSDPCFSAFYDAGSGNQLGRTTANEYKWDPAGMMIELNQPAVRHERYVYDANDERIVVIDQPSSSSETRRYALRGLDSKVARELTYTTSSNTWDLTKDYVYRGSVLLASFSGNETDPSRHYHIDHLGSPRLITDGTAHRLAAHTYLPFGREAEGSEADTERMKFTAHERDGVAGSAGFDLDYMHARYYDPNAGRFLSVDPTLDMQTALQVPQTWNRYGYARNNPIRFTDPDGRFAIADDVVVGAVIGVVILTAYVQAPSVTVPGRTNGQVLVQTAVGGFQALGRAVGSLIPGRRPTNLPPPPPASIPSRPSTPGTQATTGVNPAAPIQASGERNPAQDKLLTNGDIKILQNAGHDIHELKGNDNASKYDLYKDTAGNVYVKPKGGKGPGEETGINVKDLQSHE
jgi:RHS repeat-associated protein